MTSPEFPSTPEDASSLGFETREDPDFELASAYAEVLSAQNPDADPELISEAALELTRLLEPAATSDLLTEFVFSGVVCGLAFEIIQEDQN